MRIYSGGGLRRLADTAGLLSLRRPKACRRGQLLAAMK